MAGMSRRSWLCPGDFHIALLERVRMQFRRCHSRAHVELIARHLIRGVHGITLGDYFPEDPPARSAVLNQLLVDVRVEVEVVAYKPLA